MNLDGRAALITGGRRIGAEIARQLGARGVDVPLSYNRSKSEADETVSALEASGRRAVAIQADLTKGSECERLVNDAAAALGRLDLLINMASMYVGTAFDDLTEAEWDANLDSGLKSFFL